jgi:hypothetical protein
MRGCFRAPFGARPVRVRQPPRGAAAGGAGRSVHEAIERSVRLAPSRRARRMTVLRRLAARLPAPLRTALRGAVRWALDVRRRAMLARARRRDALVGRHRPHELAVCAIFREEAPFLDEWLRFHRGVGVTHFYLYDNRSSDGFRAVLEPWIARRIVTLTDWPMPVGQLPAYRHSLRRHWRNARWIAFIDIDEFLFSPVVTDIRTLLREHDGAPAVLVYGRFLGSAGHDARPPGPVVANFTRRADETTALSAKTIANPRHVRDMNNVHTFLYWDGEARDTSGRSLAEGRDMPVFDCLRYNHYWSRSIEDLRTNVRRGDASTAAPRDLGWHLDYERRLNVIEDRDILPVAAASGLIGTPLLATPGAGDRGGDVRLAPPSS